MAKDGHEHIDYVPSQVICEYLAQVFEPALGTRLGGLIYPSAVHPGGKSLVVFPEDRYWGTFHGVMLAHPILINRPFVVTPLGTRLCRPSEVVLDILPPVTRPFTKEDGEVVIDAQGQRVR